MKRGLLVVSLFKTQRNWIYSSFVVVAAFLSQQTFAQVTLTKKLSGLDQPTDIQFLPGSIDEAIILEKQGVAKHWNLKTGKATVLFKVEVVTAVEEGLLGLAFHPDFKNNGRFFINSTVRAGKKDVTHIDEWSWFPAKDNKPVFKQTLLEQEQPYPNHNAGQLAFGPDGYLYIGFGDGGSRNDPLKAGQDLKTWLGKMLRIDVNNKQENLAYAIPKDNPFVNTKDAKPEIWAYGLRNPWRYSFDKNKRLFVADVGQNLHEEINIVKRGGNYGWNVMEAEHCFDPKSRCDKTGKELPILSYPRKDGISITGGYVYDGKKIPSLHGKYIFADYGMGKIWALTPPSGNSVHQTSHDKQELQDCRCNPSTFGRDAVGEIYVADFNDGNIFLMEPKK